MDNGCDITVKDVEKLRQMLTPTIHTLPNPEPAVQRCMPLSPFWDKEIVAREEEQDNDIPLQDGVMRSLTPYTTHIIPPDDVAPTTNPILEKHSNEFGEEIMILPGLPKRQMIENLVALIPPVRTKTCDILGLFIAQAVYATNPFWDKEIVAREEEQDNDIPLQDGVMRSLTPYTTHIIPPDDVAPTTNPILEKHSNEFGEEIMILPGLPKRQM
ncbi:hypothetical protein Tco_1161414, partial [Tanacetum coccineum]